jgi:predicted nuclease with TOPRIM domain
MLNSRYLGQNSKDKENADLVVEISEKKATIKELIEQIKDLKQTNDYLKEQIENPKIPNK